MNKTLKWLSGLLLALMAVYACHAATNQPVVINYRLTLTADTPDGAKTGSGVIQVSYASQFNLNGGGYKADFHVRGEAIPIDLGRGNILFVTLVKDASGRRGTPGNADGALDAAYLPLQTLKLFWPYGEEQKLKEQLPRVRAEGPKDVPYRSLPTLVRFRDLNDPLTVELVQPQNLGESFGSGYQLLSAKIELTDDEPPQVLDKILTWLSKYKDKNGGLDGRRFAGPDDPLPSQFGYLTFKNWGR